MFFFKKRIDKLIDVKKAEEELKKPMEEPLEKGDLPAMLLAAFLVFFPIVIALAAVTFLIFLLFVR